MAEYIDREALIKQIENWYCVRTKCDNDHGVRCRACWVDDMRLEIEDVPAADVAPVVRGHWLTWDEKFLGKAAGKNLGVFCSECESHADNCSPYCPNCGAKMEEKS